MTPLLWYLLGIATALIAVSPAIFVFSARPTRIVWVGDARTDDTATPAHLASAEVRQ